MKNKFESEFIELFGMEIENEYFSPGRINLIGEHLDYHGGKVLPAAITMGTYAFVSKRDDKKIGLFSRNFEEQGVREFDLNNLYYEESDNWTNYVKGSIDVLGELKGKIEYGMNILFYGDIPNGAGLSSSASIEVLTLWICNDLFSLDLSRSEIALLGQKAENEFVGVNSGIMDQFAVSLGSKDKAILLDTGSLDYELIPSEMNGVSIVIMNTNKKRGLTDSDYNLRRIESEEAFDTLNRDGSYAFLTQFESKDLLKIEHALKNEVQYRRVKHVITENERVLQAQQALRESDLVRFGKYLNESHLSLKDDYEVTGIELDTLVHSAWKQEGVLGARMTGAGFGGAAIALVEDNKIEQFIQNVGKLYLQTIGYEADFYIAKIADGVRNISTQ